MASVLVFLIRVYQRLISPVLTAVLGPQCRFHPSCSHYAVEAIRRHGALLGTGYAVWRVLRCQPFCRGGHDPVP